MSDNDSNMEMISDNFSRELNIEVIKEKSSTVKREIFENHIFLYLQQVNISFAPIKFLKEDFKNNSFLEKNVVSISVIYCDDGVESGSVNFNKSSLHIHLYQLNETEDYYEEELEHDNENIIAAENWMLPCRQFDDLWDSLVYCDNIKSELLNYAYSALLFSDTSICPSVISWNKIILLHGPPGTGKTSLCRALAQKLSIRLSHRYNFGHMIEINSHSLFSKWFSESGKLVAKMMKKLFEYVENKDSICFVIIDEVESLTGVRQAALSGNEPSDAIRVVNSLLTQLDKIKHYPNVFVLTTSNLTDAIDTAFLDRTDIRIFIGNPTAESAYCILKSCLIELMTKKIIQPADQLISQRALDYMEFADTKILEMCSTAQLNDWRVSSSCRRISKSSLGLWSLSKKCLGFSGRTLRKLPFLAHAKFIRKNVCSITEVLVALDKQIDYLKLEARFIENLS